MGLLSVWGALMPGCGADTLGETVERPAQTGPVSTLRYELQIDDSFDRATMRACSDRPRTDWVPGTRDGFVELERESFQEGRDSCIRLVLRLAEQGPRAYARRRGGLSVSTAALLYRPRELLSSVRVSIQLHVPEGYDVLAPWPGSGPHFETDITAVRFDGILSLSREEAIAFEESGVRVRAHTFSQSFELTESWLRSGIRAIHQLWGETPFERVNVVVMPVQTDRAVRFGFATRGPIGTVLVMPNQDASLAQLKRDWVLPHELSHLLFPFIKEAWMSEGLATYYQEVLRARAGIINKDAAWSNLSSGFSRGRASGRGVTLKELSGSIHEYGAYVRVYWSGAALAFLLDLELRRQGSSLDSELRKVFTAERYGESLQASEVLAWLDEGKARGEAQRLCKTWLAREAFPPAQASLQTLHPRPRTERNRMIAQAIMTRPSTAP